MSAELARQDRDTRAADVGMWLFVASLVMFFGALFSGYVLLRAGSTAWESPWIVQRAGAFPGLSDPWFRLLWLVGAALVARAAGTVNTRETAPSILARYPLQIAALAGFVFCARTWAVGQGLIGAGHGAATGVPAASWFALNGVLSGLVFGAAIASLWVAFASATDSRRALRMRLLSRYWSTLAAFGVAVGAGMYLV